MTRSMLRTRLRALARDERGFTILETVIAITVIFASLTALAYLATIGFRSIAYGREVVTGNGIADKIMEEIRGQAYLKITTGHLTSELTGAADPNVVDCSGTYRFESCSGEKLVHNTGVTSTSWINPHLGTVAASSTTNNIAYDWKAYITNDNAATNPYRVTVIVSWASAAHPAKANNLVRIQSLFSSPEGCVESTTHPFAAPCQPFFYGVSKVPAGQIAVSGSVQGLTFTSGYLQVTGSESNVQNEQVTQAQATFTESSVSVTDGAGTRTEGGTVTTASAADSDPGDPGATYQTTAPPSAVGGTVQSTAGSTSILFTAPAGDTGRGDAAVAAAGTSVCPPPTDVAETDNLPCAGSRVQQGGSLTSSLTLDGLASGLGTASLASVAATASNPNKALVDREAVSGQDGRIELTSTRRIGTVSVGGLPPGVGTPPGWTGYLLTMTNYQDSATAQAGSTTTGAPGTSIAGTVSFWNGLGYTSFAANNASLNNLTSSVTQLGLVGGNTVVATVSVDAGSTAAVVGTNQTNPSGTLRTDVDASVTPFKASVHYLVTVNGATAVDLTVAINLGTMLTRGVYGQPPTPG